MSKLSAYTEKLLIPVLDLQPAFDGFDGPELWVHPNNQHTNEIAHKVAAEAMGRFILENGFLPQVNRRVHWEYRYPLLVNQHTFTAYGMHNSLPKQYLPVTYCIHAQEYPDARQTQYPDTFI